MVYFVLLCVMVVALTAVSAYIVYITMPRYGFSKRATVGFTTFTVFAILCLAVIPLFLNGSVTVG